MQLGTNVCSYLNLLLSITYNFLTMAKGKNLRLMETFNLNNVVNFVLLFFCKIEVLYKDGYFFALELEARCIGPLI